MTTRSFPACFGPIAVRFAGAAALVTLAGDALGQEWVEREGPLLRGHVQLTSEEDFARAGEAYFSPDSRWIIFQATPRPAEGEEADPHYSMYVAPLEYDDEGRLVGMGEAVRLSPRGSANTCGWFHPTKEGVVLFGSTLGPPRNEDAPGYQREKSNYKWAFPSEMEIVWMKVPDITGKWCETVAPGVVGEPASAPPHAAPTPLFERPGYDAEGSWSADGRVILYAHVDEGKSEKLGRPDADIWLFDTETGEHRALVTADGYDGGPFFDPSGKRIIYRSDRRGDDRLQLFMSELLFEDGVPVGVAAEHQLTDDGYVNWAPFFHPSGEFVVYSSSGARHNYEVWAIEVGAEGPPPARPRSRQITFAEGFDGLPVFNPDGTILMWTSQRGGSGERPSSQLWAAHIDPGATLEDWVAEGGPSE